MESNPVPKVKSNYIDRIVLGPNKEIFVKHDGTYDIADELADTSIMSPRHPRNNIDKSKPGIWVPVF